MNGQIMRRAAAAVILGASAAVGAWACLDMTAVTPSDVPPPPAFVPEAGTGGDGAASEASDGATGTNDGASPCQQCVTGPDQPGPGCGTEVTQCLAEPECAAVYECVVAAGCLLVTSRQDLLACGTPCVIEAGITSQTSEAGVALTNLIVCAIGPCGGICSPTD